MNEMNQQQQQLMNMNQNLMSMNQINPQQIYGMWPQPPQFQNPNPMEKPPSAFNKSLGPRSNWKGKKTNKPNIKRRREINIISSSSGVGAGVPTLNEMQRQNRLKTRKFFPKNKFNKNSNVNMNVNNGRSAPFAPRNTTSFIIRAKKSGGIASLVSPCPVTPAVLPTPIFSPSREVLVDMAKEEWGVDGYGSMKGLIRLRSPGHEMEAHEVEEEDDEGSSESDLEEHVEVEKRLDHDLSRFEMIYNPNVGGMEYHNLLENRVDDQDTHIAHLEEENLILKERLFLMERELGDLRRMMLCLERRGIRGKETIEEVVENESDNESEEAHSMEDNNGDFSEDNVQGDGGSRENAECFEPATTTENFFVLGVEKNVENNDNLLVEADKNLNISNVEGKEENKTEVDNAVVEDIQGIKNDENKALDVEMKAEDDVHVEFSEPVMVGEGVNMEEIGVVKDNMV
ncbi:hypothetical protein ACJIZ3_016943 [Penstemon smallii]|uniref:PRLI-interacting factor A n=1 Tax=Penstemon smallii TaxID=265156 RepID=A0ABD3SU60_9LAMI